jgi:hypothetical protein
MGRTYSVHCVFLNMDYTLSLAAYQAKLNAVAADTTLEARIQQAAHDLDTKGYAVIGNVVDPALCDSLHAQVWQAFEQASRTQLKQPHNPRDLLDFKFTRDWPRNKHGIMEDGPLAHMPFMHAVRTHPAVATVFARLYGASEGLVFAPDRMNYQLAPEWLPRQTDFEVRWMPDPDNIKVKSEASWLHVDQALGKAGRHCIQGLVVLVDADQPGDASLEVVEGSHLMHATLEALLGLDAKRKGRADDWYKFTDADKNILEAKGVFQQLKIVRARKGSLVLWDSRLMHQGGRIRAHPTMLPRLDPRPRCVVYVCIQPALQELTTKQVTRKRQIFANALGTSHWPLRSKAFGKPRTYGRDAERVFDWAPVTNAGQYPVLAELAGLVHTRQLRFPAGPALLDFDASSGMRVTSKKREATLSFGPAVKKQRVDDDDDDKSAIESWSMELVNV